MTIERPMFPPRAGKPALRLVGGIDSTPSEPESLPAQRKPKERGPYKQQARKKYQNGVPVIDQAKEDDVIFRHIAEHRAAIAHYDRCVDLEGEAEGKVSDDEYSHLQRNSRIAFDEMMLFARAVILDRPTTRRGLIHQARYLASQLTIWRAAKAAARTCPIMSANSHGRWHSCGASRRDCGRWPTSLIPKMGRTGNEQRCRVSGRQAAGRRLQREYVDKLHAEAFRDLESGISDCVLLASIAVQMAEHAIEGRDAKHEKAMFAVFQVAVMLKKLKADYHAAWHGERRST